MTQYWQEHASEAATMVEMMLDHDAEELNEEEMPEILSYLPDYTAMRILELGAGIGYARRHRRRLVVVVFVNN